jgi:ABC-type taurine transport system substrate-binding protein
MTVGGGAFAQTKVRVGNVNTVSDIGIFIADKKGYFKAEGLDVEFIAFNTAARMIAPLGSGQLDVGGGTVSAGLYNAFTRKIGIRIVADKGSSRPGYNFSQIMVRKDLVESGRYKSFKDLKGMKVAVAAVGTASQGPPAVPSSWKLDNSSTHTAGSGASVASSAVANVSSMVGPMLPAAATVRPQRSTSKAHIAVVVVLPLVPVMASTLGA